MSATLRNSPANVTELSRGLIDWSHNFEFTAWNPDEKYTHRYESWIDTATVEFDHVNRREDKKDSKVDDKKKEDPTTW